MNHEYEAFTAAEAEAMADDMNHGSHWGASPVPCWCGLSHPPGAVGTVPPPLENELPGADHLSAPGAGVPARMASGAVRAPNPPADDLTLPPMSSAGAVSPEPPSPCGTGADGEGAVEAEPPALPVPGTGTDRRNPDAALPFPVSPSLEGSAVQTPAGAARSSAAAPAGSTALERWREALAAKAKARRQGRGKHRKAPEYGPGMNRRQPPAGGAA